MRHGNILNEETAFYFLHLLASTAHRRLVQTALMQLNDIAIFKSQIYRISSAEL